MATRIYDGFRFASPDLLAIHGQLTAFRPVFDGLAREASCRFLARDAVERIDRSALKGEPLGNPLAKAFDALNDRQRKIRRTDHRDPEVDHEFLVRVLPFEGRVYGLLVSEQDAWKAAFMARGGVEDFAFWTTGDRPEGMPRREWERRRDLWHRLLEQDPAMRPAGCGFSVEFLAPLDWPEPAEILPHLPDRAGRVAKGARNRVLDACLQPRWETIKAGGPPAMMAALHEAEAALREDPAMRARLAEETAQVEALLPAVTVDLLLGKA